MLNQKLFSGVDQFFKWVQQGDGTYWYEFDSEAARKAALRERNAEAKRLASQGLVVTKFSLGTQLRSRGGVGTLYPHIEFLCTTYGLNASEA